MQRPPTELLEIIKGLTFEQIKEKLGNPPYSCIVKDDSDYPEYFIINYNQVKSDFSNLVVQQCRGIILDKETHEVVCRGFDKFFNYGEVHAVNIDWKSAYATEKIDGSLIKVWWSERYKTWMISTNGTINAFNAPIQSDLSPYVSFGDMFYENYNELVNDWIDIQDNIRYDYEDEEYVTFLYELCSPWTRIVVPHDEVKLYHLGIRGNSTGRYYEYDHQDPYVPKPKKFDVSDLDSIVTTAQELPYDQEGYVIIDKDYNRLKVKSPKYLAVHHLKNNGVINKARVLDLIIRGEQGEFLSYFPEFRDAFEDLQTKLDIFMKALGYDVSLFEQHRDQDESRKDFAMWAKRTKLPALMFSLLDGKISLDNWQSFVYSMSRDKILQLID